MSMPFLYHALFPVTAHEDYPGNQDRSSGNPDGKGDVIADNKPAEDRGKELRDGLYGLVDSQHFALVPGITESGDDGGEVGGGNTVQDRNQKNDSV